MISALVAWNKQANLTRDAHKNHFSCTVQAALTSQTSSHSPSIYPASSLHYLCHTATGTPQHNVVSHAVASLKKWENHGGKQQDSFSTNISAHVHKLWPCNFFLLLHNHYKTDTPPYYIHPSQSHVNWHNHSPTLHEHFYHNDTLSFLTCNQRMELFRCLSHWYELIIRACLNDREYNLSAQ